MASAELYDEGAVFRMGAVDVVPEFFAVAGFFVEHLCVDHGCEADVGAVFSAEEAEG